MLPSTESTDNSIGSLFECFFDNDPLKIREAERMIARHRRRDVLLARAAFARASSRRPRPDELPSYYTEGGE